MLQKCVSSYVAFALIGTQEVARSFKKVGDLCSTPTFTVIIRGNFRLEEFSLMLPQVAEKAVVDHVWPAGR